MDPPTSLELSLKPDGPTFCAKILPTNVPDWEASEATTTRFDSTGNRKLVFRACNRYIGSMAALRCEGTLAFSLNRYQHSSLIS
jgi:hypothetical protein